MSGSRNGSSSAEHVVPVRLLAGVLAVLMLLTWVTVGVTSFDLGEFNLWIALGIALVKSSLVALYFMHLRWERPINTLFFVGALLFVVLFIGLTLMDIDQNHADLIPGYAPDIQ